MESTEEEIQYTRDMPIWWHHSGIGLCKAFFVGYRKTAIVIDELFEDGSTRRRLAKLDAIQPREEEEEQP